MDEDGNPMAHLDYQLVLADGGQRTGQLDADGCLRLDDLAPGECLLSFPAVADEDWTLRGGG